MNIKEGTLGIAGVAFSYCSGLTSITIPDSVTSIGDLAFFFCDALTTVNYEGDKSDRKKIAIDGSNDALLNATWHYNACIHDFALLKRVAKTCAADGYDLCRCTKCGVVAQQNIIPAGHDYEETVVAPTCTEDGYTLYQCVDCSAAYKDQYVPAHHDYVVTTVVAPTCTEGGYTLYRCVSCGDGYQGDFTEKLPHDYRQTIRAATCTEDGYKEYTCAGCGDCYKKPSGVAATGHYVFDGACVICGMAEETIHHIEEKTAEMMPYLQTAVQLKQHGDSCDLRFVSMVDSDLPDYESVGFIMEIMGYEQKISTPTVYTSFLDETAGKVTAAQYGADYFILTTANIGSDLYGEKITVRPYIELVGGGIIKGNALEFVLNDYIGG